MKQNVGKTDKIVRVVVAVIAAYLGYSVNPLFYIITAIGLLTAAIGFCGLYPLLNINTATTKSKSKSNKK